MAAYSFHCTACGKCCTSPPLLSVPELLLHQDRFIGCLGVRRLGRSIEGVTSGHFLPFTTALAHVGADRCPELDASGHCRLHEQGKPVACQVVPLDALLPDAEQGRVLDERLLDTERWGVGCLVRSEAAAPSPEAVLVQRLRVVGSDARGALALHRRVLGSELRFWGRAVFTALETELGQSAEATRTLAVGGVVTLSLAPVILTLAATSDAVRRRLLGYADAQLALTERVLGRGTAPGDVLAQVRAFARTSNAIRRRLAGGRVPESPLSPAEKAALAAWLGVAEASPTEAVA